MDGSGKGWITMTFDYACEPRVSGNTGYFGFDIKLISGGNPTIFKFRPSNNGTKPVLTFFRHDTVIFGTSELVSSLGPVGEYTPAIKARCVLAYNQTPGMWDVELGYSVGGGPMKVTTMKNISKSAYNLMDECELDFWKGSLFWMDNIKLEWNEGDYNVTATLPASDRAFKTKILNVSSRGLLFYMEQPQQVGFNILTLDGTVLHSAKNIKKNQGENYLDFNVINLNNGIYIVELFIPSYRVVKRFTVIEGER